jgi:hypothetical protein
MFFFPFKDLNPGDWDILKAKNKTWNEVDLRDNRYDQIIHLVRFFYFGLILNFYFFVEVYFFIFYINSGDSS